MFLNTCPMNFRRIASNFETDQKKLTKKAEFFGYLTIAGLMK